MEDNKNTCPSCGYLTFEEGPGSEEICDVCGWQDDVSQLKYVKLDGANKVSLIEAQKNFDKFGAITAEKKERVNSFAKEQLHKDTKWRKLDEELDRSTIESTDPNYPTDYKLLYYWVNNSNETKN